MGKLLLKVSKVTPGGILMFYPSYTFMRTCIFLWKRSGLLDEISYRKKIVVDGDFGTDYKKTLQVYYENIFEGEKKGSILISVCRGRLSEGMDFSDDAARAVLVVGVPFA